MKVEVDIERSLYSTPTLRNLEKRNRQLQQACSDITLKFPDLPFQLVCSYLFPITVVRWNLTFPV